MDPRRRPGRVSGEGPCALALVLITFLGRPQRRRPGRPRGVVPGGRRGAGCTVAFRWARLCVCVRVCVRVAWGRPIRGAWRGGEANRSALVTALGSLLVTSMLGHGGAEGDGSNRDEAESGPSRRRDSGSPLISLCLRWDGVPRASPSAAVRMCCALVRSALTVVRSKRCVAGFRCRAGRACGAAGLPWRSQPRYS